MFQLAFPKSSEIQFGLVCDKPDHEPLQDAAGLTVPTAVTDFFTEYRVPFAQAIPALYIEFN